jgi:thiol-disulfide isomerase/thioredoxin
LYQYFKLKSFPKKDLTQIFNSLNEKYKKTQFATEIREIIANNYEAKKGVKFPAFNLLDKNDNSITLNDFRGKYLLIEFTASWCGPCKQQIPFQKEEYKKYQDKNFEILHIYLENKEKMIKAIEKDSIPWVNVYDNEEFNS